MLQLGGCGVASFPPVLHLHRPWLHDDRFARSGQAVGLHRALRLVACAVAVRIGFHFSRAGFHSDALGEPNVEHFIDVRGPEVDVEELVGFCGGESVDPFQAILIRQGAPNLLEEPSCSLEFA